MSTELSLTEEQIKTTALMLLEETLYKRWEEVFYIVEDLSVLVDHVLVLTRPIATNPIVHKLEFGADD